MRKLSVLISIAILGAFSIKAATPSASAIIESVRKNMSAPAVEILFTAHGSDSPTQGSLLMSGTRLALSTPVMNVWYDGTTQWTYFPDRRELDISEPERDEILATNPFAILGADASAYKSKRLPDAGKFQVISLTPADKKSGVAEFGIVEFIIYVDPATKWPQSASVKFDNGSLISLTVEKINSTGAKPISAFRYDKALYPADEIIDLR